MVTVNVRSGAIAATLRRVAALQADATTQEANANLCLGPGEKLEVTCTGTAGPLNVGIIVCGSLLLGEPE